MKAIRHTLTERWYAWDNARYAAMEDPEVNLYAAGTEEDPAYIPLSNSKAQYADFPIYYWPETLC